MNQYNLLYFTYGICIMFHLMMACIFLYRQTLLVKRLVGVLMLLVAAQYGKDLVMFGEQYYDNRLISNIASSIDIVTVPFYVLILIEACRPGWLTWRRGSYIVAPFLVLTGLYVVSQISVVYHAILLLSLVYGVGCAAWTLHELPIYHRRLREEYSFEEDINLHWLRGVMVLFFVILLVWVYTSSHPSPHTDVVYMMASVVGWSVTCFFFYRQHLVLQEVRSSQTFAVAPTIEDADEQMEADADSLQPDLRFDVFEQRINSLFETEHVYLDPHLRLSELAQRLGTNRTYLSQYFNKSLEQTFYDYVNSYRIEHAKRLLRSTDDTLDNIASASGFNSISTFRRSFRQKVGCSAIEFRNACDDK